MILVLAFLLAQAAPAGAETLPVVDYLHVTLGVLVALGPVFTFLVARFKWGKAAKLVALMQDASDKHAHGEPWSQAVLEEAAAHSDELLSLAQGALPARLGGDPLPAPVVKLGGVS